MFEIHLLVLGHPARGRCPVSTKGDITPMTPDFKITVALKIMKNFSKLLLSFIESKSFCLKVQNDAIYVDMGFVMEKSGTYHCTYCIARGSGRGLDPGVTSL